MSEIITIQRARQSGLKHYFTGNPCKNGHISRRWTSSGMCLQCNAETANRRYHNNREHYTKKRLESYHKNKKSQDLPKVNSLKKEINEAQAEPEKKAERIIFKKENLLKKLSNEDLIKQEFSDFFRRRFGYNANFKGESEEQDDIFEDCVRVIWDECFLI